MSEFPSEPSPVSTPAAASLEATQPAEIQRPLDARRTRHRRLLIAVISSAVVLCVALGMTLFLVLRPSHPGVPRASHPSDLHSSHPTDLGPSHTGDLRSYLLPIPADAQRQTYPESPDGRVDLDYAKTNVSTPALQDLLSRDGFGDGAIESWKLHSDADVVVIELWRFGDAKGALDFFAAVCAELRRTISAEDTRLLDNPPQAETFATAAEEEYAGERGYAVRGDVVILMLVAGKNEPPDASTVDQLLLQQYNRL